MSPTAASCVGAVVSCIGAPRRWLKPSTAPATSRSSCWRGTSTWATPALGRSTTSFVPRAAPRGSLPTTGRSCTSAVLRSLRAAPRGTTSCSRSSSSSATCRSSWAPTTTPSRATRRRAPSGPTSVHGAAWRRCAGHAASTMPRSICSTRRSRHLSFAARTSGHSGSSAAGTSARQSA